MICYIEINVGAIELVKKFPIGIRHPEEGIACLGAV